MDKRIRSLLAAVFLGSFLIGCAGTLAGYQPQSREQKAIKDLLVEWQTTWINRDVQGNLALYADQATIMYGRERKTATKEEYADILPERMEAHPKMQLGEPDIDIQGRKATARFGMAAVPFHPDLLFRLVKDDGGWSIISWEY